MLRRLERIGPDRLTGILFALDAVLSLAARPPFLFHISSWWRSSHTLWTSYWFQKEGLQLLHYQTPLFGYPWEVPFEFPLYQALSAIFANLSGLDITLASRLTSVVIFYASAVLLFLLCLEIVQNRPLTLIILTVYIWLPFSISYSTEILIDYLSLALALGYLLCLKKWLDRPRSAVYLSLAIVSGCLGAMIKAPTMATIMIPAVLLTLAGFGKWGVRWADLRSLSGVRDLAVRFRAEILSLLGIGLLPVLAVVWWTRYTDDIKAQGLYTRWLTLASQEAWLYGSWAQKLSLTNWLEWLGKIRLYFFLGVMVILPLLALVSLIRAPRRYALILASAVVGTLLTIFIFFNLYFHDYYYIAVSANMSIVAGFGIYALFRYLQPRRWWLAIPVGIFLALMLRDCIVQYKGMAAQVPIAVGIETGRWGSQARDAAAVTPPEAGIIAFQSEWYPDFLLLAERKGLVIAPRAESLFTCQSVSNYSYSTVAVVDPPQDPESLTAVLTCFKTVRLVEPGLYSVGQ